MTSKEATRAEGQRRLDEFKARMGRTAPSRRFVSIAGYIAFYAASKEASFVGGYRMIAQPCHFYGGWVTDNLRGRIKGAAGTEHW